MSKEEWINPIDLFPGRSNGEYGMPPELVPIIQRGNGCRIWDETNREWLDMTMAWGAALVGHAHPKVVEAVINQVAKGANFAAINSPMVRLAEQMEEICPCVEKIRFVASGTEATMLCLRVARAATGRAKVLKFTGAYHGQHPVGVASMIGDPLPECPRPDGSGTGAPWIDRDVVVAPYNRLEEANAIIEEYAGDLAAVIVEPLHRCLIPEPGFLEGLRAVTQRFGIVLVFDEVVTGFRLALGGAQEYYGVQPDLAAYGKALGGGMPIGAFGGRRSLMDVVDEHRMREKQYVWSASTTGGNPVSAAAALATLDVLSQKDAYENLHAAGKRLRERMRDSLKRNGESARVLGDGPLAQIAFSDTPVIDHAGWLASNRAKGKRLMIELLRRGVFLNPMGTKLYLSIAHEEADVDRFIEALDEALKVVCGKD